jgi:hypothetical protein
LLVQQGALVQSVARVDVEREVDDGGCEGEAAELIGLIVSLSGFLLGQWFGTEAYEAGCEAHCLI